MSRIGRHSTRFFDARRGLFLLEIHFATVAERRL